MITIDKILKAMKDAELKTSQRPSMLFLGRDELDMLIHAAPYRERSSQLKFCGVPIIEVRAKTFLHVSTTP